MLLKIKILLIFIKIFEIENIGFIADNYLRLQKYVFDVHFSHRKIKRGVKIYTFQYLLPVGPLKAVSSCHFYSYYSTTTKMASSTMLKQTICYWCECCVIFSYILNIFLSTKLHCSGLTILFYDLFVSL